MSGKYLILCISLVFKLVQTSHFRGGTISWKPTGNGNEVLVSTLKIRSKRHAFYFHFFYVDRLIKTGPTQCLRNV